MPESASRSNPQLQAFRKGWQRLSPLPLGKWAFSRLVGRMVPYSGSIRPYVEVLSPGYGRISIRDRRGLRNHLRSVHAIARALSAAVGTEVTAEYIQRLVEAKLVPIGIIAAHSTSHAPASISPAGTASPRSPLALNMRMALVSPRLLDPATRVLTMDGSGQGPVLVWVPGPSDPVIVATGLRITGLTQVAGGWLVEAHTNAPRWSLRATGS